MNHGGDRYRNKVNMDFSINVNPLGMPASVTRSLHDAVEDMVYYPDPQAQKLTEALAEHFGIPAECILLGNGASELLMAITRALPCSHVLLPVPSFGGYQWALAAAGADIQYYSLKEEDGFRVTEDLVRYLEQASQTSQTSGVKGADNAEPLIPHFEMLFLTNPNNPTGLCIEPALLDRILEVCRRKNILVVLDECFMELTDHPEHTCMRKFRDNLIILRAFTKSFAIPGIRLGYLAGARDLLSQIKPYLPEWNVSGMAQAAGLAAMKETAYLQQARALIARERGYLAEGLQKLGYETWPSETNFILFRERGEKVGEVSSISDGSAENGCAEKYVHQWQDTSLYWRMLARGILIRDCSDYQGLEKGYYRIAVRTHEENRKLLEEMQKVSDGLE